METLEACKHRIKNSYWDFPGDPVVKIPSFQSRGAWVQSLVRELKSHVSSSQIKKKLIGIKRKREILYSSAWVAITQYYRLGSLDSRNLLSYSTVEQKFKIKFW